MKTLFKLSLILAVIITGFSWVQVYAQSTKVEIIKLHENRTPEQIHADANLYFKRMEKAEGLHIQEIKRRHEAKVKILEIEKMYLLRDAMAPKNNISVYSSSRTQTIANTGTISRNKFKVE